MEKKIASFISVIFHPIFVLLYAFGVIIYTDNFFALGLSLYGKIYFTLYVLLLSVVFPMISLLILKYFKLITSFKMEDRRERRLSLTMLGMSYLLVFFAIDRLSLSPIFNLMVLAAIMLCVILFVINTFWKISIHTTIWGGFVGILMAISMNFNIDWLPIILLVIFLSGLVGYARLKLKAHTAAQIYVGYITGFLSLFLLFLSI